MSWEYTAKLLTTNCNSKEMFVANSSYEIGDIIEDASYGLANGAEKRTVIALQKKTTTNADNKIVCVVSGDVQKKGVNDLTDAKINKLSASDIYVI